MRAEVSSAGLTAVLTYAETGRVALFAIPEGAVFRYLDKVF